MEQLWTKLAIFMPSFCMQFKLKRNEKVFFLIKSFSNILLLFKEIPSGKKQQHSFEPVSVFY